MKFYEHVDAIVGSRDRVVVGPQRALSDEEIATFENKVYNRKLNEYERGLLLGLCILTQYALAHQEAGLDAIANTEGETSVEWELSYTNDRHERLLGTHPVLAER